jgi:glycine/D-amino acid oxidase-like deaminating enzyme
MKRQLNLWHASGGEPINAAPLERDVVADVVIVGGGFTGCSAALHLAESGVNAHLLEAQAIGHGGSGRNVGLVNAGLWTPPDAVEHVLGRDFGQRLNEMLASAPDLVFELIARHGIECEAARTGTLHCAHGPSGLAELRGRYRQQLARHAPVRFLDAAESRRVIGTDAFQGALFDPRAGTIQPLAYVRGLARAALAAGATLYENSPANSFEDDRGVWKVRTQRGTVVAKTLIQATDSYEYRSKPPTTLTPVQYFQCATPPLSAALRSRILPGREGCWDTATVMSSFRLDAAGRMIIGAVGSLEGAAASTHIQWAMRKLVSLFPELAGETFKYAWSGRIGMTSDHLPKVIELGPRGIAIYGYSGRGIGPGSAFGKAAAAWACGADSAFPVQITRPRAEPFTTVKKYCYELGSALTHLFDARRGRHP